MTALQVGSHILPHQHFAGASAFIRGDPHKVDLTGNIDPLDYIAKEQRVYADGVAFADGIISWNAVEDKNHCYYRVFTSDIYNFVPSKENQIASTVSTTLQTENIKKYIKVISVDKSGNM